MGPPDRSKKKTLLGVRCLPRPPRLPCEIREYEERSSFHRGSFGKWYWGRSGRSYWGVFAVYPVQFLRTAQFTAAAINPYNLSLISCILFSISYFLFSFYLCAWRLCARPLLPNIQHRPNRVVIPSALFNHRSRTARHLSGMKDIIDARFDGKGHLSVGCCQVVRFNPQRILIALAHLPNRRRKRNGIKIPAGRESVVRSQWSLIEISFL